ncbi:hypothetical protein Droror1_Dr00011471 [Drosera rotundifolia]
MEKLQDMELMHDIASNAWILDIRIAKETSIATPTSSKGTCSPSADQSSSRQTPSTTPDGTSPSTTATTPTTPSPPRLMRPRKCSIVDVCGWATRTFFKTCTVLCVSSLVMEAETKRSGGQYSEYDRSMFSQQQRDEKIKEAILYCKKTLGVDGNA